MSDRRFEITGTQVVASVLAAVTGAVAASYLGVAGTIIGTAVMSVASTAGSAFYKFYLGRTARRLKEKAPVIAQRAAERTNATGAEGTAQRRAGSDDDRVAAPTTVKDHRASLAGIPPYGADTRGDGVDSTAAHEEGTRVDEEPVEGQKTLLDSGYRRPSAARRGWRWLNRRPAWLVAAVASVGIFLGVVGAISVFEAAAGKPLEAVVWHRHASGTTVGGLVGGQHPSTRPATPATHRASPSVSPSGVKSGSPSPSVTPTSGSPTPSSGSPSPSSSASSSPSPSASPSA